MIVFRAKVGVDIQYIETIRGKQKVVGDLRNINSKGYTKILQEYYRDYCFDKSDAQPIYSKYKLCFIDIMVDSNNNMRSYPPLIVDYDDDGNPYVYLRFMYTKASFTCDWVNDKDPVKSITTKKETRDFIKDIFEKYLTYYPESPSTEKRYIAKANTIDYIEEYKGQLFITYASIFSDWCFNCQPTYISYGEDEIEEGNNVNLDYALMNSYMTNQDVDDIDLTKEMIVDDDKKVHLSKSLRKQLKKDLAISPKFYKEIMRLSRLKPVSQKMPLPYVYVCNEVSSLSVGVMTNILYEKNLGYTHVMLFSYNGSFNTNGTRIVDNIIVPYYTVVVEIEDIKYNDTNLRYETDSSNYTDVTASGDFIRLVNQVKYWNCNLILIGKNRHVVANMEKILDDIHVYYVDLTNDTILDKSLIRKELNEMARKDGFPRYLGKVQTNREYTEDELRDEYNTWRDEYWFNKVSPKINNSKEISVNDPRKEFKDMIGLKEVKSVVTTIIDSIKMKKILKDQGVSFANPCMHMFFYGNPGTAKTTVARLIGDILGKEHVLKTGNIVEVSRADLVSKYLGGTAPKIVSIVNKARGGILFVDEAYSLVENENGLYGDEAINTFIQQMELVKDDTIIIFAGYPDKMKKLLEKNEGFKSRIAFHVKFPDYTKEELLDIFKYLAKKNKFSCTDSAIKRVKEEIDRQYGVKDFGNGRFVRNILEQSIMKCSSRLLKENQNVSNLPLSTLTTLEAKDIIVTKKENKTKQIGFNNK